MKAMMLLFSIFVLVGCATTDNESGIVNHGYGQSSMIIGGNLGSDLDGDGILDDEEVARGTDPRFADTDEDGLSDMEELCVYETNPLVPDSDGDGLPDGWEIDNGLDPLSAEGPDGADGDPYGSGICNRDRFRQQDGSK